MKSDYSLLRKGDKIGLITPAGVITKKKLETAILNIRNLNLKPHYFPEVLSRFGYLAGEDEVRVNELHNMYLDKTVKAILCVRGGYGTTRILNKIDYNIIKQNPKPLIGYSDITALFSAIYKETNIPGFHGVVGASKFSDYTAKNFHDTFLASQNKVIINSSKESSENAYTINRGIAEGIITGGNMSMVISLLGTEYEQDWQDKIIFLEEVNEAPYKIDRMLTQLHLAGKFNNIRAIIFGTFEKCDLKHFKMTENESFSLKQVITVSMKNINVPAVYGFSFGHIKDQAIFPFGANVSFDADKFQISYLKEQFKDFF